MRHAVARNPNGTPRPEKPDAFSEHLMPELSRRWSRMVEEAKVAHMEHLIGAMASRFTEHERDLLRRYGVLSNADHMMLDGINPVAFLRRHNT